MPRAVVFDLDGVLLDSEQVWDDVREQLARERGGRWHAGAQAAMMGMSSPEWAQYMHDVIGLEESPEAINDVALAYLREDVRTRALVEEVGKSGLQHRERIAELLSRGLAERVLVLTPAGLREQWGNELAERFGIHAAVVDMGVLHPPLHVSCVMGVTGGIPPTARNLALMADNVPAGSHWNCSRMARPFSLDRRASPKMLPITGQGSAQITRSASSVAGPPAARTTTETPVSD